jgi:hypothetical protein
MDVGEGVEEGGFEAELSEGFGEVDFLVMELLFDIEGMGSGGGGRGHAPGVIPFVGVGLGFGVADGLLSGVLRNCAVLVILAAATVSSATAAMAAWSLASVTQAGIFTFRSIAGGRHVVGLGFHRILRWDRRRGRYSGGSGGGKRDGG